MRGERRRASLIVALGLVGLMGAHAASAADASARPASSWRSLGKGLDYRKVRLDGTVYHAVRVSLADRQLAVADARLPESRRTATVDVLGSESGASVAINGTFFDEKQRPLGLLVSGARELNPLRPISWWAALVVRPGTPPRAEILPTSDLKALAEQERSALELAIQVGPRTVAEGKPLALKPQVAARSAVCVTAPHEVILLATEGAGVESNALAAAMARPESGEGFACTAGLMLDGGPSTQLWISAGGLDLEVRGGWGVPNAIVVLPRARSDGGALAPGVR